MSNYTEVLSGLSESQLTLFRYLAELFRQARVAGMSSEDQYEVAKRTLLFMEVPE